MVRKPPRKRFRRRRAGEGSIPYPSSALVAKLVDAPDLESGVFDVSVRVRPSAPESNLRWTQRSLEASWTGANPRLEFDSLALLRPSGSDKSAQSADLKSAALVGSNPTLDTELEGEVWKFLALLHDGFTTSQLARGARIFLRQRLRGRSDLSTVDIDAYASSVAQRYQLFKVTKLL